MGCPRIPSETFERLWKMKADLEEAIEAEKTTLKNMNEMSK
jgi:hypothetical protein